MFKNIKVKSNKTKQFKKTGRYSFGFLFLYIVYEVSKTIHII